MTENEKIILRISELLDKSCPDSLENHAENSILPDSAEITGLLDSLRRLIFKGYFGKCGDGSEESLRDITASLEAQIKKALIFKSDPDAEVKAREAALYFISKLPEVRAMLEKDVEAGFNGDPAAKSRAEIIVSYPGLYAIFVYRLAHLLYERGIPLIPRMMTEHAHSLTGIDINSGAVIGESFFIDHGTGVVIGETTVIGNNVKLYQGVTLGALSTRMGQKLAGVRRHPTIEDEVTVYSGATILGGETVIGRGAIIGGNAFITKSIPPYTKVIVKTPELILKTPEQREKPKGPWEI